MPETAHNTDSTGSIAWADPGSTRRYGRAMAGFFHITPQGTTPQMSCSLRPTLGLFIQVFSLRAFSRLSIRLPSGIVESHGPEGFSTVATCQISADA